MKIGRKLATALLAIALAGCRASEEGAMASFMLNSSAFDDGQQIPTQFTCDGDDKAPPLAWAHPPEGMKSFALVVDDPDAPSGTFSHWGAWNIPADSNTLEEGQADRLPQAVNDFGRQGYGGACPPEGHGPHRYRFKLFALDTDRLELPPGAKVMDVERAAAEHMLGKAELTGTYERK